MREKDLSQQQSLSNNLINFHNDNKLKIITSDIEKDMLEIKKNYYIFISTIVGNNLINILISPGNIYFFFFK